MTYQEFLERKLRHNTEAGFDIHEDYLNKYLFDFQKFIVRKALKNGRYAIFADCGLGKTLMQLEWANQVNKNTAMPVLILCPLAVAAQTIEEGNKFGIEVSHYGSGNIQIINYDQIDNITAYQFSGIVLDESSILKNFTGETTKKILDLFAKIHFKLCCTATPSPNDDMEICNHAEFLAQGKPSEIMAMYFTHDGGETQKWRLKGHARRKFWNFVKTWSCFVSNPSDLGFDGSKFILPKLNLIDICVQSPSREGRLFNDGHVSATNFNQELRDTKEARLNQAIELSKKSKDQFIIWIKQNEEADYLCDRLEDFREVRGSDTPEKKERDLMDFAHGKYKILITKAKIAQFGLNFQNCHNQIFASLDFSFEGTYQAIRRSYRFGQKKPVNVYMITTESMANVIGAIRKKEDQFQIMKYHLTTN
jgi:hypothetical protein